MRQTTDPASRISFAETTDLSGNNLRLSFEEVMVPTGMKVFVKVEQEGALVDSLELIAKDDRWKVSQAHHPRTVGIEERALHSIQDYINRNHILSRESVSNPNGKP